MVYFLVNLVNTIKHTFPTFEIKLTEEKKTTLNLCFILSCL